MENITGERLGDPLLFIGVRHSIGHLLHLLHRIAHRDTISAAADHLDIVFRISKDDVFEVLIDDVSAVTFSFSGATFEPQAAKAAKARTFKARR